MSDLAFAAVATLILVLVFSEDRRRRIVLLLFWAPLVVLWFALVPVLS